MDARRNRPVTETPRRHPRIPATSMHITIICCIIACLAGISEPLVAENWKLASYDLTSVLKPYDDSDDELQEGGSTPEIDGSTTEVDSLNAYLAQTIVQNKMSGSFQFVDNGYPVPATGYEYLTFSRLDDDNAIVRARYTNFNAPNQYKGYVTFNLTKSEAAVETTTTTTTEIETGGDPDPDGSGGGGGGGTCCKTTVKVFTKNTINVTMPAVNVAAPNVILNAPDHTAVLNEIRDVNRSIRDILREQNNSDGNQSLPDLTSIDTPETPEIEIPEDQDYEPEEIELEVGEESTAPSQGMNIGVGSKNLGDLNLGTHTVDFSNLGSYMETYSMTPLKTIFTSLLIFAIVVSFFYTSSRILTS